MYVLRNMFLFVNVQYWHDSIINVVVTEHCNFNL
jgi:hypothetical protein